ncbi:MAG: hypothetical protein IPH30_06135 [Betaproteobacteria bacterium]|nr:hypothetical protein [Betaproteobacteria bacterium]
MGPRDDLDLGDLAPPARARASVTWRWPSAAADGLEHDHRSGACARVESLRVDQAETRTRLPARPVAGNTWVTSAHGSGRTRVTRR